MGVDLEPGVNSRDPYQLLVKALVIIPGKKIKEPRLQFREFFSIGFIYWVNKKVVRAREVN